MAIQDYILNGRPGSELLFAFLRDRTPYVKMGRSLPYQVFNGYRIKMGFFKCPFHGLRRAVGTNMVVAGIPVTTVSQVLGHSGIDPKVLPRVRPYDLCHRFASTVLHHWLDEGQNLYAMLPYLRAYMGTLSPLFTLVRSFFPISLPEEQKCSQNTIRSYRKSLEPLFDFVKGRNSVAFNEITFEMMDRNTVSQFLSYLETERNCSISTRNHRLHCIRAFFKYAVQEDITVIAHLEEIQKVKRVKQMRFFSFSYTKQGRVSRSLLTSVFVIYS